MFPENSDLSNFSSETQNMWLADKELLKKFRSYFTGDVFKAKVPLEAGVDEDVELYPVGLNLVKMLCIAQADSLWGEWEDKIVQFGVEQDAEFEQPERDAAILLDQILTISNAPSLFWELGLDREIFGGAAMKITPHFGAGMGLVKWSRVSMDSFYPIWDPENPDILLEVWVVTEMTKEQAKLKYGYETKKNTVLWAERWNNEVYEVKLDNKRIDAYSGINPWGVVPFVYFPRMRTVTWWGDSLTQDIMRTQDELNMRIADIGEAVHYNSHPTRFGYNLPKAFNTQNYPLGPNVFWDLGRKTGDWPEPKVGILQSDNPIPSNVFEFVNFLYDWTRTSSSAPPIAFGEDDGGGQRSGITLEIRMWPLIKATRRSRGYMTTGILRGMRISSLILSQKNFDSVSKRALTAIRDMKILPHYSPVMPRDQAALVDEVVKRLSTTPPTISLQTAVKKLGEGITEVERIDEDLEKYKEYRNPGFGNGGGAEEGQGASDDGASISET